MAVYPSALSSSKRYPSLKHAPTLTLVLFFTVGVHLTSAYGDDHKILESALPAKVSKLLVKNDLVGKHGTDVDSSSRKVSLRKAESFQETTTSSEIQRRLEDSPVNLINWVLKDGKEMCLSLADDNDNQISLQVCDESDNRQKWLFTQDSFDSNLQSYFNSNLCLTVDCMTRSLMTATCDFESEYSTQKFEHLNYHVFNINCMSRLSAKNGCEGVEDGSELFMNPYIDSTCGTHQKWNITAYTASQNAPPGMLNVTISRTGDTSVSEGATSTQKTIRMNYLASTNGGATVSNATIFEKDCKTPANATLPVSSSVEGDNVLNVEIDFNFSSVESNLNIWETITNDAGEETGGDFRFCLRVEMFHVATNNGLNFHETNLTGRVDKTAGAGFTLVVNVTRDDAKEETVNDVNFDASVVGTKCDVSTLTSNNDPVSQGSVLGLCVRSNTTGIKVVGWDSLKISRVPLFEFEAIKDGVPIPVLVAEACDDGKCTSQVQLVSGFFDSDGELSVDGKVILAVNDTRRHLVADMNDVTDISDEAFGRILTDQGPTGGFKLDIDVVSSVSASTTLYPGSFYPFVVAFMALKFLIR